MSRDAANAWAALAAHHRQHGAVTMVELFAADPGRADAFTLEAAGLTLDYSKNRIGRDTMPLLADLARAHDVEGRRQQLFAGEPINVTERRPALHPALRRQAHEPLLCAGTDVVAEVHRVQAAMAAFSDRVRDGSWRGYGGEPITDVVNLGIGGSDLGPQLVTEALRPYHHPRLTPHFVANIDPSHLATCLARLRPATTLVVVASKTFTTQETMANAQAARAWLLAGGAGADDVQRHFVAVTANRAAAQAFGIGAEGIFDFWEWVGGRTSVWSAVGLSVALLVGMDQFRALLAGARAMDHHFVSAPIEANMPMVLALIGIWYVNFFAAQTHAVLPYDQLLARLPAYLQQLEMESNGKGVTQHGIEVAGATCPIVWGEPGTLGQHAFYQLLHQGTHLVPCDFIGSKRPKYPIGRHHTLLMANLLAQSAALMRGQSEAEAERSLLASGMDANEARRLAPHKRFPGNRPSNTLLADELTPGALGSLLALYEHKVFVQGTIWQLNSYDQWGVELGKQVATGIAQALEPGGAPPDGCDPSTRALIARLAAPRP